MKVRKGFVSNSSSSSYLVYGFFQDDLPTEIAERWNEERENEGILWDYICGYDNEIIGADLAHWSDTVILMDLLDDAKEILEEKKAEVKKVFKDVFDYDVPDDMFKVIATTYYNG